MIQTLGILFLLMVGQAATSTPHSRFGLWEVTDTVTPAGMGASGQSQRVRECIDGSSNALIARLAKPMAASCTSSNETQTNNVHSMDITCPNSKSHHEIQTFSPDHYRSTTRIQMATDPQHRTFTSVVDFRFISASCGDLKPGQVQPIP